MIALDRTDRLLDLFGTESLTEDVSSLGKLQGIQCRSANGNNGKPRSYRLVDLFGCRDVCERLDLCAQAEHLRIDHGDLLCLRVVHANGIARQWNKTSARERTRAILDKRRRGRLVGIVVCEEDGRVQVGNESAGARSVPGVALLVGLEGLGVVQETSALRFGQGHEVGASNVLAAFFHWRNDLHVHQAVL